MSRPTTISDSTLLEAARAVFLERGDRATSAEIARRARVSVGTLFHRFSTKERLFEAAMAGGFDVRAVRGLLDSAGEGSVDENLVRLGLFLCRTFSEILPRWLVAFGRGQKKRPTRPDATVGWVTGQRALASYLREEIARGRIRPHEPAIVASAFAGAMWAHALEGLTGGGGPARAPERYVRGVVQTLWQGLAPPRATRKRKR